MTTRPQIDATDAMRNAGSTVEVYLNEVIDLIETRFGEGYAKKNPDLVASLVTNCAEDFNTTCTADALWAISDSLKSNNDF